MKTVIPKDWIAINESTLMDLLANENYSRDAWINAVYYCVRNGLRVAAQMNTGECYINPNYFRLVS